MCLAFEHGIFLFLSAGLMGFTLGQTLLDEAVAIVHSLYIYQINMNISGGLSVGFVEFTVGSFSWEELVEVVVLRLEGLQVWEEFFVFGLDEGYYFDNVWGTLTRKVVSGCSACSVYEIYYVFGHVILDYAVYWQREIQASWSQVTADHNLSLSWGKLSEGVGSLFSS